MTVVVGDMQTLGWWVNQGETHAPGDVIEAAGGTFVVPTEAQVEDGVGFGENATEFEGTLALSIPAISISAVGINIE